MNRGRTPDEIKSARAGEIKDEITRSPALVTLNTVEPREVRLHWAPYLIKDELNLLYGDGGQGKSYLTHVLIAANSRGHALPGEEGFGTGKPVRSPSSSAIISAEDGLPEVVVPRLIGLDADLAKVHAITGVSVTTPDGKTREVSLTLDDIPQIEAAILEIGDLTLLVIDPVQSYVPAKTDMYRGNEFRPILEDLARLAQKYGVTVVLVTHMNRNTGAKSNYRVSNSQELVNRSRSVLVLAEDPDLRGRRVIAHDKHNNTRKGESLTFEIREDGRFYWTGTSDYTADDILGPRASSEERSARDEAAEWLEDLLGQGPVSTNEVKQAAGRAGFSWPTVERAKTKLGITASRSNDFGAGRGRGSWAWALPTTENVDGLDGLEETPSTSAHSVIVQDHQGIRSDGLEHGAITPSTSALVQDHQDHQQKTVVGEPAWGAELSTAPSESEDRMPLTDLKARAATWHAALLEATLDDLAVFREDHSTPHTPEAWESTALTEPRPVTVAVILISEDIEVGTYQPGSAWKYLGAARHAEATAKKENAA